MPSFTSTLYNPSMDTLTRAQLIDLFHDEATRDLSVPDLEVVDWGVLDYFGWINHSGNLGFVVQPFRDQYKTLKLHRSISSSKKPKNHMCSWCRHVYRGQGTALFSCYVDGSDGRRIIGQHLCRHLDCSIRIRNLASDPPSFMPETIDLTRKINRLEHSIIAFMLRTHRIDSSSYL